MLYLPEILRAFSVVLSYPGERMLEPTEFLYVALHPELPDAAKDMSEFGSFVEQSELSDLEEAYNSTFDINPACALEVGWHLFGEEYERGQFLVRMREELRKFGIAESSELPDHITHVLAIVAEMPDDEASRFVRACVLPALGKMQESLDATDSAYRGVFRSLGQILKHQWPDGADSMEDRIERAQAGRRTVDGVDLLHAYPVADAPFFDPYAEAGCQSAVDVVPLQMNFNGNTGVNDAPAEVQRPDDSLPTTHHPRPTTEP